MRSPAQPLTIPEPESAEPKAGANPEQVVPVKEINGPAGLEPTRYGDWERNGRCVDF